MPTIFEEAISLKALVRVAADYAERNAILVALARSQWNKAKAAKTLKISIVSLASKIRYHGIEQSNEATQVAQDTV